MEAKSCVTVSGHVLNQIGTEINEYVAESVNVYTESVSTVSVKKYLMFIHICVLNCIVNIYIK